MLFSIFFIQTFYNDLETYIFIKQGDSKLEVYSLAKGQAGKQRDRKNSGQRHSTAIIYPQHQPLNTITVTSTADIIAVYD